MKFKLAKVKNNQSSIMHLRDSSYINPNRGLRWSYLDLFSYIRFPVAKIQHHNRTSTYLKTYHFSFFQILQFPYSIRTYHPYTHNSSSRLSAPFSEHSPYLFATQRKRRIRELRGLGTVYQRCKKKEPRCAISMMAANIRRMTER